MTDQHRAATMRTLRTAFLSALVLELAATLATAVVAVEVGLRLLAGHLSYQTALLVLLLTPEAYLPLRAVGLHFHASQEGAAAAGRVLEILDVPLPADVTAPADRMPDLRCDTITLADVWLAYPGRDQPALRGIDLQIRPGEVIAITGQSGAGKSSLVSLLLRFTEPAAGRIDVGGIPWPAIPAGAWRQQLAWVPQRPYLFAGTVAENIALGRPPPPWPTSSGPPRWRAPRTSSPDCPAATRPSSVSEAARSPPASASGSRWPGPSCGTHRCCCSTSRPRTSTRRRHASLAR